jgi:very-short-patch-repair endonuclease
VRGPALTRDRERARQLRRFPTEAEVFLWRQLRSRAFQGLKFRRQVALGKYIADFVCLEKRLIIEVDGGQHNEQAQRQYDEVRDEWLRSQGFRILRYWNNEVFEEFEAIAEAIWRAAKEALTPDPSPARGEGRKNTEGATLRVNASEVGTRLQRRLRARSSGLPAVGRRRGECC